MRKFEIYNKKFNEVQAYLYLDTEKEEFKIRVLPSYKGMHPDAPFFFYNMCHPDKEWMDERSVDTYIKMRILPSNRHALNQYLSDMGLTEYNVVKILDYTKGRCVMDESYFREVPYDGVVPEWGIID